MRKNDSFEAFDEVLQKAEDLGADMVLLGGDLFHENKPSRTTLVKAISSLRKHCLSRDKRVAFSVVSDISKTFVGGCARRRSRSRPAAAAARADGSV